MKEFYEDAHGQLVSLLLKPPMTKNERRAKRVELAIANELHKCGARTYKSTSRQEVRCQHLAVWKRVYSFGVGERVFYRCTKHALDAVMFDQTWRHILTGHEIVVGDFHGDFEKELGRVQQEMREWAKNNS